MYGMLAIVGLVLIINLVLDGIDYEKWHVNRLADRSRRNEMKGQKKRSAQWRAMQ